MRGRWQGRGPASAVVCRRGPAGVTVPGAPDDPDVPGRELAREALAAVGLRGLVRRATAGTPEVLTATVAVGLTAYADLPGYACTAPSPDVVEAVLDALAGHGVTGLRLLGAGVGPDARPEDADLSGVLARLGLTGCTARGTGYEVVAVADDLVPLPAPVGSALDGSPVCRSWLEAPLRVVVAPCATDAEDALSLGLVSLLGVLPEPDRRLAYRVRRRVTDVLPALLAAAPPDLVVVDAVLCSAGPSGVSLPRPLAVGAVVAATDAVLADVTAAALTGTDPAASPLVAAALRSPGLPRPATVTGDLTPCPGWAALPPALSAAVRDSAGVAPEVGRVLAALLAPPDPAADGVVARLAPVVRALLARADSRPASFAALLGGHAAVAAAGRAADAWVALVAKDRARQLDLPLGLDLADWAAADYDAVPAALESYAALLDGVPPDATGVRRRPLDGSWLVAYSRVVPAAYDDWVARVDISAAIRLMADYLGGSFVPVSRDADGAVVRQAERNVYLPQPNHLALAGGQPIDVCKLERVDRRPGWCRIAWRTVASPNRSATYDDGWVVFEAVDERSTRVSLLARQEFALPAFWQVVDLRVAAPAVYDLLVEDAYARFLALTFDGFEAAYEGRDPRIGQPVEPDAPLASAGWSRLLATASGAVRGAVADRFEQARPMVAGHAAPAEVDEDGFTHVPGRAAS